eukprot:CAMPEP_0181313204 /NCGR_PEP_ID=MMETSP1101-20121128/14122_1 /TAXON_ID=46948 /ORGANISM="Rhodomonas abbreviata, Strain Caron Lab Isolate" /LENGTH=237 /DNA_ID=CAMNT_0023420139 /DNA_START=13 /DNA_END=726 /DNA_ORIENTATION=+
MADELTTPMLPRSELGQLELPRKSRRPKPPSLTRGLFVPFVQEEFPTELSSQSVNSPTPKAMDRRFSNPEISPVKAHCNSASGPAERQARDKRSFSLAHAPEQSRSLAAPSSDTVSYFIRWHHHDSNAYNKVTGVLENGEVVHGGRRYGGLKEFVSDVKSSVHDELDIKCMTPQGVLPNMQKHPLVQDFELGGENGKQGEVPATPKVAAQCRPKSWSPGDSKGLQLLQAMQRAPAVP